MTIACPIKFGNILLICYCWSMVNIVHVYSSFIKIYVPAGCMYTNLLGVRRTQSDQHIQHLPVQM